MDRVQEMLAGSGAFALSFAVSLALLAAFVALYSLLTTHNEMKLIRGGNTAAALSLGGAVVGFVLPVSKAVAQSANMVDLVVWAAIAFVAQMIAYFATAMLVPHLHRSLDQNNVASGTLLAALSIGIGLLNAAAMTV
jgi:putative membrane protein